MMKERVQLGAAAALLIASFAGAQPTPPPPAPPAEPTEAPSAAEKPAPPRKVSETLPGLDELLGIPGGAGGSGSGAGEKGGEGAGDRSQKELEKKLSAKEMADKFQQAIEEMGELADRLERSRDTGLETQRLHEQVIEKLDALVKSSKSKSSSGSSSSSSSSREASKSAPSQPQPPKPGGGEPQAGEGENKGEAMPPGFQSPELRGRLDVARAAWGSLPARVRDSLMQGSSDQFSSLYEALTQEYYRRLAEEAKP